MQIANSQHTIISVWVNQRTEKRYHCTLSPTDELLHLLLQDRYRAADPSGAGRQP